LGKISHVKTTLVVFGVFAVVMSLHSQEAAPAPKRTHAQEGNIERGHKQFVESCSFCHGENATGAMGPDLIHSKLVRQDKDGDLIGPVVKLGRPDKGMPALGVTETQIADLVAFLHAQTETLDSHSRNSSGYPHESPAERSGASRCWRRD